MENTATIKDILKAFKRLQQAKTSPELSAKIIGNLWESWPHSVDQAVETILKDTWSAEDEAEDKYKYKLSPKSRHGGTPQRTYLLDRKHQDQEFYKDEWIRKPSTPLEYGLVKKAVGDRVLPVWLTKEDVIDRSKVTPIGNTVRGDIFVPRDAMLPHPGYYPSAFYVGDDGRFYSAGFDLNDYEGLTAVGKIGDTFGSPVVVKTGIQPLEYQSRMYENPSLETMFFEGLERIMTKVPNYDQIMYDKYNLLPEITVTPKKSTYNKEIKLRKDNTQK